MLSGPKTTTAAAYSPLAHNGLLQGLAEGGLLLGIPLVVALLAAAYVLLRALRHPSLWRGVPFAAGITGLGLLAHGLVDFDWTFPADVGVLAICVALAAAPRWHGRASDPDVPAARRSLVACVVLVSLVLVSGVLAFGQHFEIIHADPRPALGASL
jgi:O-antigen ligase